VWLAQLVKVSTLVGVISSNIESDLEERQ